MIEEKKKRSGEKTRREFLKDAGLLIGGTAIGSTILLSACAGEETTKTIEVTKTVEVPGEYAPAKQMVQADPYYCSSCSTCAAICSAHAWGESNPALSAIRVTQDRINGEITINTCHQCAAPSCMQACLFDAMYIDENTGARVIDQDKCTGCRQCQYACPFDAVVYNPKTNTCFKCDLCGGEPLCAEFCTAGTMALKLVDPIKGGV